MYESFFRNLGTKPKSYVVVYRRNISVVYIMEMVNVDLMTENYVKTQRIYFTYSRLLQVNS